MPRNEDGEFELILGNKQLLSVFFIVVILLGVFFTMGYIVGRNSSPLSADSRRPDKPTVIDPGTRPNPAGGVIPSADTPSQPPPTIVEAPASRPAEEAPRPTREAKPEPQKAEKEKPAAKPQSASPTPDQPAAGEKYLQVAAVAKSEAQLFVDVLAKKGFHAIYAQHPDQPQTYRVLVGPFKDAATIAQARTDLEKAGFQGLKALVRNY